MVTIFVSSVVGNLAPRIRNARILLAFLFCPGNAILLNGVSQPHFDTILVQRESCSAGRSLRSPAAFPKRLAAVSTPHRVEPTHTKKKRLLERGAEPAQPCG